MHIYLKIMTLHWNLLKGLTCPEIKMNTLVILTTEMAH